MYLSLGSTTIIMNNTEILITSIGDDNGDSLPPLICHTDLVVCCTPIETNMTRGIGDWRYPNRDCVPGGNSTFQPFVSLRNVQSIQLVRRDEFTPPPLDPTGSYCCIIPTNGEDMTFCAKLGELLEYSHSWIPSKLLFQLCACLSLSWPMEWSHTTTQHWVWTLWPPTPVILATVSLETPPGLVGVMECGVALKLQLVKVSLHAIRFHCYNPFPVVCPVLALDNGYILYSADSRRVGTSATYSCIVGYRIVGEPVMITCQLSDNSMATWSESSPICKGVSINVFPKEERRLLNTTLKKN